MRQSLELLAATASKGRQTALTFDWAALRYQHTARLRRMLLDGQDARREERGRPLAPAAVNRTLAALRGVLKESWRLGLMTAEDYHRAVDFKLVKATKLPHGRQVPEGELRSLFQSLEDDGGPCALRDRALLALAFGCGLRRAELVGLDLVDYDTATDSLIIRHGKGRKERRAWIKNGTHTAVTDWLAVRGPEPGPLFYSFTLRGRMQPGARLSTQAVYWVCRLRAEQAEVPPFTPHDCRRTFITGALDVLRDLSLVAELAGHARPDTTKGYDMRGERERAKAAGELYLPVGKIRATPVKSNLSLA
jgi:integrase